MTRSALVLRVAIAGALVALPCLARAQGVPTRRPPADTSRARPDTTLRAKHDSVVVPLPVRDTTIRVDSSREARDRAAGKPPVVKADSVKPPTARSEVPALLDAGEPFRWNREELFASGALTLLDLLDRVPGLAGFRTGFLAQAEAGAYLGDLRRVRVFLDGLELDALGTRANGALDLASVQLWNLEDVAVERSARELRVYARTLRTTSVTPYTRVDALTGDQRLTLFRGFYGKRGSHGEVAQFGVQQLGTSDTRSPGGSSLGITTRLGWSNRRYSVDAYGERVRRDRNAIPYYLGTSAQTGLPAERGTYTRAYLRAAAGDPDAGPWLQASAGTLRYFESSPHASGSPVDSTGLDFADTNSSRAQYLIAGGLTYGATRLSLTDRVRGFDGHTLNDAIARASLDARLVSFGAMGERNDADSLSRIELTARLRPFGLLSLSGTVARSARTRGDSAQGSTDYRAEGAFRVSRGAWVGGGLIVRDSTLTGALGLLGQDRGTRRVGRAVGEYVLARGRVYRSIYADVYGLRWGSAAGLLRPQFESRAQLYLSTRWLSRFPSGNFGVTASLQHEYRSAVTFLDPSGTVVRVPDSRVPGVLVEVRIVSAVVSYQYRNFTRERYQLVPGVLMPIGINVYGVRWEFFN